jgi:hypothetical protein
VENFNQYQFSYFPSNVNMLIQVYEEDHFNDWRMAEDLFYSFGTISPANKDFMIVHSDRYNDQLLEAGHISPLSSGDEDIDAIDYHALYRIADALAATAFENDTAARHVALGHGASVQTDMGSWPDGTPVTRLTVTDHPVTPHGQNLYLFGWSHWWNKRRHDYKPVEKARPDWLYQWTKNK